MSIQKNWRGLAGLPVRLVSLGLMLLASLNAYAYVGPGLGAGTIGVILGILVSILLAIFAIFWYPIKRLFKKKKKTDVESANENE